MSLLNNFEPKGLGGVLSQSAKRLGRATNSLYFSNKCGKYNRLSSEIVVFREHVCKVQPLDLQMRRISRTRVQNAAGRAFTSIFAHVNFTSKS